MNYDDFALQFIEREIIETYHHQEVDYPHCASLLEIRKRLLNKQALKRENQKEFLSIITAFNEALRNALRKMYDDAHTLYAQVATIQPAIELNAKCFLAYDYPSLHPYRTKNRKDLFDALCDTGWNPLYNSGVTHSLDLPRDIDKSFNEFIGMDCPPPNWNEGLDQNLTKDLHLINAFHNLFEHTNFALTDFIFVREFTEEININYEQPI